MGFLVKIDSYKFCHCIYWLKCELSYIVVSSDRSHVNWLPWFKILNLLENLWFSSIFSDLSLSLPHLQKFLFPLISFRFNLRISSLIELDEGALLLQEVEDEFLLLLRFLLFTFWTFSVLCSCCIFLVYEFWCIIAQHNLLGGVRHFSVKLHFVLDKRFCRFKIENFNSPIWSWNHCFSHFYLLPQLEETLSHC